MSAASTTQSPRQLDRDDLASWTRAYALRPSNRHTDSLSTRRPSLYDTHLPLRLQPALISLRRPRFLEKSTGNVADSPAVVDEYFQKLSAREGLLDCLTGDVRDTLRLIWEYTLGGIKNIAPVNEDGVIEAEKDVFKVVFCLAALAIFDLSKNQLQNLHKWAIFARRSSTETETKADLLFGLHDKEKIVDDDKHNTPFCDAIWPLLQNLPVEHLNYIATLEGKNLLLVRFKSHLLLLLFSRIIKKGDLHSIWPEIDCMGCAEFKESHRVHSSAATLYVPQDSQVLYGLSPMPDSKVDEEIRRLLNLTTPPGNGNPTALRHDPTRTGVFYRDVLNSVKKSLQDLGAEERLLDVMEWAERSRNMFVQGYAQLVRHNLTFGLISSYNQSFLLQRIREDRTVILSYLQQPTSEGFLLQRTLWLIDAWHDAIDRNQNSTELWDDPYKSARTSSYSRPPSPIINEGNNSKNDPDYVDDEPSEPDSDASDPNETGESRRSRRKTKARKRNTGRNPNPPSDPPGKGDRRGGGAGGAGSAGGSAAGSSDSASSTTRKRATDENKSKRSQSKRGRRAKDCDPEV
ncbi:hypothetical protein GYMLUDRAFT_380325 [Collybiopsis luxurians FD-317 M1]|nr:hypothetical protein GYMLUDRAFT_380325 [Collybiopsis luxurians FD-317 M1]